MRVEHQQVRGFEGENRLQVEDAGDTAVAGTGRALVRRSPAAAAGCCSRAAPGLAGNTLGPTLPSTELLERVDSCSKGRWYGWMYVEYYYTSCIRSTRV